MSGGHEKRCPALLSGYDTSTGCLEGHLLADPALARSEECASGHNNSTEQPIGCSRHLGASFPGHHTRSLGGDVPSGVLTPGRETPHV